MQQLIDPKININVIIIFLRQLNEVFHERQLPSSQGLWRPRKDFMSWVSCLKHLLLKKPPKTNTSNKSSFELVLPMYC